MRYRGYTIAQKNHPTPCNRNRQAWDILDGDKLKKANIASLDTAKHVIDIMVKYGYWEDRAS